MKVFSVVLLTALVVSVSVLVGFQLGLNQKKQRMLACTVERIIDDENDEPAIIGQSDPPRTILSYSPKWMSFNLPGVLGKPGELIYIEEPSDN